MNTVERVKSICKERGITIAKLERDLGFANGYISQLRKGVLPDDRLNKISLYLGVSGMVLSGAVDDEDLIMLAKMKMEDPDEFKIHVDYLKRLFNYRRKECL